MKQRKNYKALFIIPINTAKNLNDDGWEFKTKNNIPSMVKKLVLDNFSNIHNCKDDPDTYRQKDLIIDFFYTDDLFLESIYIRDYSLGLNHISFLNELFSSYQDVEIFIP